MGGFLRVETEDRKHRNVDSGSYSGFVFYSFMKH